MTTRTVLEEIVTVFTGDAKQLDRTLNHVTRSVYAAQKQVENSVAGISNAIAASGRRARSAIVRGTAPGVQPMQFASAYGGALPFARHAKAMQAPFKLGFQPISFARVAGGALPFAGGPAIARRGGMFGGMRGALGGIGGMFAPIISGTAQAIGATGAFFHHFNRGIRRMWYDVRMMGHGFRRYIVAPFLAGIAASAYGFAKFDDAIHYSMALFGGASKELEQSLERTIFAISKNSRTSPQQLAELLKVLASANYSAADSMKVLGIAEKFYVASGMEDASKATQLLIGVQAALGLRVGDSVQNAQNMTRVGNLLVKANQLAQVSVEDFAEALTNKAAAGLRMVGKDAEEGLAILAAYAAQNVKGAAAGTQFAIVLRDVQRAVLKHPKQWESIVGKRVVFDAAGQLQNLGDIVGTLSDRFETMTDAQRAAATVILGFNDRSSNAIKMLMGMGTQIRAFEAELRGAGNEMERVYQERMKSFMSVLKQTWNWIHTTGIEIGRLLEPEMRSLAASVRRLVSWWDTLSTNTKRFIIYSGFAVIGIGALVAVLISFGAAAAAIVSAWTVIGPVLAAVGAGLGVIVAAIGGGWVVVAIAAVVAAVAGLIYMIAGPKGLAAAWSMVTLQARLTFGVLVSGIKMAYNFWSSFIRVISTDFTQLPKFAENLMYNFGIAIGGMTRMFSAFAGWLTAKISRVFTIDFIIAVGEGIKYAAKLYTGLLTFLAKGVIAAWQGNVMGVVGFIRGINDQVKKMSADFAKGQTDEDLFKSLNDILADTNNQFRSLTHGIKGLDDPAKNLYDLIVDPLTTANKLLGKANEQMIMLGSNMQEGVLAGSAEAFDIIRAHLESMSPNMTDLGIARAYTGMLGAPDFTAMPEMSHPGPDSETSDAVFILGEIRDELKSMNMQRRIKSQEVILQPMRLE